MATIKKALRGLANLNIFPITENTTSAYTVGTAIPIEGVQEFTATKEVDDWKIFADDGIFDSGSVWKGCKFTLVLAGLPLELRKHFEGGEYDEETQEYTFKSNSEAAEIGLTFSSISGSNQNEMTRIYSVKCTKVSFEHKTKGDNNAITPVKIEGDFSTRKMDNAVFMKKDAAEVDTGWLSKLTEV